VVWLEKKRDGDIGNRGVTGMEEKRLVERNYL